jgi:hypothetical protein
MTDREAMQMALDALESLQAWPETPENFKRFRAIEALHTALAQPKKEWVGLTKEEAREICVKNVPYVIDMVAALEAKLKEKNNG